MTNEFLYRQKLREIAEQLERWAEESKKGGWSTHQVEPMLQKAREIFELIGRNG